MSTSPPPQSYRQQLFELLHRAEELHLGIDPHEEASAYDDERIVGLLIDLITLLLKRTPIFGE